jgi:hypothetical protein
MALPRGNGLESEAFGRWPVHQQLQYLPLRSRPLQVTLIADQSTGSYRTEVGAVFKTVYIAERA